MVIKTKDLGLVEIREEDIIYFEDGLFAFEDVKGYVVLKQEDVGEGFMHLQAVEQEDPRFILFDPYLFFSDYNPQLTSEIMQRLGAKSRSELALFVIAVIPAEVHNTTVNLKSPVIINFHTRKGVQLILENDNYPIRCRIFQNDKGGE